MKKTYSFLLIVVIAMFSFVGTASALTDAAKVEGFENASLPGSYSNGSFDNNGITWTYENARNT